MGYKGEKEVAEEKEKEGQLGFRGGGLARMIDTNTTRLV